MFNFLLPLGMKWLKTKTNYCISLKYLCISYSDRDNIFLCYNDFGSPLKINESIACQNDYETQSFQNNTIKAPLKICGLKNILF